MNGSEVEEAARELRERWRRFYENVEKPGRCMFCPGTRINWNGSRNRSTSVLIMTVVVYLAEVWCRRVKCADCRKSWTLRPPELVAHKHFQLCVVARATSRYLFEPGATLSGVGDENNCSRHTVKRWLRWTAAIAQPAIVLWKVLEATDTPLVPRLRPVRQLARKAVGVGGRLMLKRAAEVLGLMESLASAWGLEPPGLRAVVRRVLGERSGIGTYLCPAIPELVRRAG